MNCGAEIRPGNAFCVSCGAPVSSGFEESGSVNSGPATSEGLGSFAGDLRAKLRRAADRLGGAFSGFRAEDLRHLTGRAPRWFRNLPGILKLVLVGAVVLVLAVLLSPLSVLICALVFGVSLIALIVRVAQRGSIRGWGIIAVASLVLMLVSGGISDSLYGTAFVGRPDSTASKGDVPQDGPVPSTERSGDGTSPPSSVGSGNGSKYVSTDPDMEEMVADWRSSGTESPLFVPTYMPFPVEEVGVNPFGTGLQEYYLWSEGTDRFSNHLRMVLLGPATAPSSFAQGTVNIDGRDYPYTENPVEGEELSPGNYVVLLWVDTEGGEEYMYQVEMNTAAQGPLLPPEEFTAVVASMDRIDPSDV
jgi:zinc-ribbon domain